MEDLYDILKDYKLHEERHIPQRFLRMGRASLRSFLEDLALYGSQRRGQRESSGFLLAPIGGSMGLGSAEDVAHETALYADHLVLTNELSPRAMQTVEGITEGHQPEFERNRKSVLHRLYPFLVQYLRIRPLWQRGMASFGYPDIESQDEPVPERFKELLIPDVDLQITGTGTPWFALKIGGNRYVISPDIAVKSMEVITDTLYHSTRERMNLLGETMLIADKDGKTTRDEPEKLLDTSHPLYAAFDETARSEAARLAGIMDFCARKGAHFVTDQEVEWRLIAGGEDGQQVSEREAPVAAFDLAAEIAFIRDVSLEEFLQLRESLGDSFEVSRRALLELSKSIPSKATAESRKREAQRIVAQEIRPALAALSEEIRTVRNDKVRSGAGIVAVASVSVAVALFFGITGPLTGGLGTVPLLKRLFDGFKDADSLRQDPLYFLWKAKQSGN